MTGLQCVACGGRAGRRGFPLRVDARRAVEAAGGGSSGRVPAAAARLLLWVRSAASSGWLLRRVRAATGLRGPLQLFAGDHVLLPDTPLAVIRPHSTVTVIPTSYEWFIDKFNEKEINHCHTRLERDDFPIIDENSVDTIDTHKLKDGVQTLNIHHNNKVASSPNIEPVPQNINNIIVAETMISVIDTVDGVTKAVNGDNATTKGLSHCNTHLDINENNSSNSSMEKTVDINTNVNNEELIEAETELETLKRHALEMLPDEPPARRRRRRVRRRRAPKYTDILNFSSSMNTSVNSNTDSQLAKEPATQVVPEPSKSSEHLFFNLSDTEQPVTAVPEVELTPTLSRSEDHSDAEVLLSATATPCHKTATPLHENHEPLSVHNSSQVVRVGPKQNVPRLVRSLN